LQTAHDGGPGGGKPLDASHPMLAEQARVVAALDSSRRFLPTSSSGPTECASLENFGKGLHHDVHGPWVHAGPMDTWRAYWDLDDALFRSETGMQGASPADVIRATCGSQAPLPASSAHPLWMYSSFMCLQWDDYLAEGGDAASLDAFVAWSQRRQADGLAYAVAACKRRFPACGGVILWMGHDSFPCLASLSILDVRGRPKPAALAVGRIFR
jgi:beta-mannosidase